MPAAPCACEPSLSRAAHHRFGPGQTHVAVPQHALAHESPRPFASWAQAVQSRLQLCQSEVHASPSAPSASGLTRSPQGLCAR